MRAEITFSAFTVYRPPGVDFALVGRKKSSEIWRQSRGFCRKAPSSQKIPFFPVNFSKKYAKRAGIRACYALE
jgi:hypothetical protein